MSPRELKEEFRQTEGDPTVIMRLRRAVGAGRTL
jgi:flagellar biosynthesis protein FlhB